MMATKLVVGLGNPGREYQNNRHNVGFSVLDDLAARLGVTWTTNQKIVSKVAAIKDGQILLVKPQAFMNDSGRAVLKAVRFYKLEPENLLVVHDDADLDLGQIRLVHDSVSAGHHGVQDIIDKLGTKAFLRLRIGVGRPKCPQGVRRDIESYVLQNFDSSELEIAKKLGVEHLLSSLKL